VPSHQCYLHRAPFHQCHLRSVPPSHTPPLPSPGQIAAMNEMMDAEASTPSPTPEPTNDPTPEPSYEPTPAPPTESPTENPTFEPSVVATFFPTPPPTPKVTDSPTKAPTKVVPTPVVPTPMAQDLPECKDGMHGCDEESTVCRIQYISVSAAAPAHEGLSPEPIALLRSRSCALSSLSVDAELVARRRTQCDGKLRVQMQGRIQARREQRGPVHGKIHHLTARLPLLPGSFLSLACSSSVSMTSTTLLLPRRLLPIQRLHQLHSRRKKYRHPHHRPRQLPLQPHPQRWSAGTPMDATP
jgi:hypothetical protein